MSSEVPDFFFVAVVGELSRVRSAEFDDSRTNGERTRREVSRRQDDPHRRHQWRTSPHHPTSRNPNITRACHHLPLPTPVRVTPPSPGTTPDPTPDRGTPNLDTGTGHALGGLSVRWRQPPKWVSPRGARARNFGKFRIFEICKKVQISGFSGFSVFQFLQKIDPKKGPKNKNSKDRKNGVFRQNGPSL